MNQHDIIKLAFFDELEKIERQKLAKPDREEAMASLQRLERMDQTRPTGPELARGAIAGTSLGVAGNLLNSTIAGTRAPLRAAVAGGPTLGKQIMGAAIPGVIFGAALPVVKRKLDESAEKETLRAHLGMSRGGARSKMRQTLGVG